VKLLEIFHETVRDAVLCVIGELTLLHYRKTSSKSVACCYALVPLTKLSIKVEGAREAWPKIERHR
jgi:hypothetical protein